MKHTCTPDTDLDELIGRESMRDGIVAFDYGPIPCALRLDEELVLENSAALSATMHAKIAAVVRGLFIPETEETLLPGNGFAVILGQQPASAISLVDIVAMSRAGAAPQEIVCRIDAAHARYRLSPGHPFANCRPPGPGHPCWRCS